MISVVGNINGFEFDDSNGAVNVTSTGHTIINRQGSDLPNDDIYSRSRYHLTITPNGEFKGQSFDFEFDCR